MIIISPEERELTKFQYEIPTRTVWTPTSRNTVWAKYALLKKEKKNSVSQHCTVNFYSLYEHIFARFLILKSKIKKF